MTAADLADGMARAHGTANRYHNGPDENGQPGKGCRCTPRRRRVADLKNRRTRLRAYGQWEPFTDAAGTRRRLEALMFIGVPSAYLAGRLGMSREALRQKMSKCRKVTPATAAKVAALTRELHCRPLPEGTPRERRSADRARRHARRMGWVPLAAWDDIDDPAAVPAEGWERGEGRERGTLAAEALDLIGFGLDVGQAAERLGVARSTLGTTLARVRGREAEEARDAAA